MPVVSVIIPSFNHEHFIRQCVDSALSQSFEDFEIIVVDDGSSDSTLEILSSYGSQIRLIEQNNRGTQAARNRGIQVATGKYIALLDSDDVWLPEKLATQVEAFDNQPELGLIYSYSHTINGDGTRKNEGWYLGKPIDHPDGALAQLILGCFVPALTAIFPSECIAKVGNFDEHLLGSGDWDLWIRIATHYPIACIKEPLALYRVHSDNTTKKLFKSKVVLTEHEEVLRKAFLLPEVLSLPHQIRDQALARLKLESAEVEAIGGDAKAVGRELKKAGELDPSILDDEDVFTNLLIHLAHVFAKSSSLANPYIHFVSETFSELSPIIPTAAQMRRTVLADSVMANVFEAHRDGDQEQVRALLFTGLYSNPKWLRNRGIWSIMADAYLGRGTTLAFRNVNRKVRDLIS